MAINVLKRSYSEAPKTSEIMVCVPHDGSAAWPVALEKRRRLGNHYAPIPAAPEFHPWSTYSAASTSLDRSGAIPSHPPPLSPPPPPVATKLEPGVPTGEPESDSYIQGVEEAQQAAEVLTSFRACLDRIVPPQPQPLKQQRQRQSRSQRQPVQAERQLQDPQHAHPQHHRPTSSSSASGLDARVQIPLPSAHQGALPSAPSQPPTGLSDGLLQLQPEPWVAPAAARPVTGASICGAAAPWRGRTTTVTTGAAATISGGLVTTGVVTTGAAAAAAPATMTGITSGVMPSTATTSGTRVVTGSIPVASSRGLTLKRRHAVPSGTAHECPPTVTAVPSAPAHGAPAAPHPGPAAYPTPALLTHGSASQDAGKASTAGGVDPEAAPQGGPGLEDESAPSTPPRSPGARATPPATPQHPVLNLEGTQPHIPQQQQQQLSAEFFEQLVTRLNSQLAHLEAAPCPASAGHHDVSGGPRLVGFRVSGVQVAAGPRVALVPVAASTGNEGVRRGQVVQVCMRLSPLVTSQHVCGSADAAAAAAGAHGVDETVPATSTATPPSQQQQQPRAVQYRSERAEPVSPGVTQRQQQGQPMEPSQAEVQPLPAQPAEQSSPSSSSSEGLHESPLSAADSWLSSRPAPSEPVLPGLERLLAAAAAATEAAASAARSLQTGPAKLPVLPIPALTPEAFCEPDGSLLRGAILKAACDVVRLTKLIRAGFNMSLPWTETDPTAAATPAVTASSIPGSTAGRPAPGHAGLSPAGASALAAAAAASGCRTMPLAAVLKALADFAGAGRALQRAEAWAAEDYRALRPLMRLGHKCAEVLMFRVERALLGESLVPHSVPSA